jgi:hypothetical protein
MTTRYAEQTTVPADRSRAEIERTLQRYGADGFMYGWEATRALVQFQAHDRYIRFIIEMPDRNDFTHTPAKRQRRSDEAIQTAYEQAQRQRWRALALVIKAKLEAVAAGITEFESEFLAHIVLPDGTTVGDWVAPQVARAYELGTMPKMLPMPDDPGYDE